MRSCIQKGLILIAILIASSTLPGQDAVLKEGDQAPEFALPDQDGVIHRLSDYRGERVLVYFYPKDDTPGCTKEACALRDDYSEYESAGIVILGISYDTQESHQEFRDKYDLPFTLLSDAEQEVSEQYGTKGVYPLAIRRSFLIDEEGYLLKIIENVDVTTHSQDVLRHFREATSPL